MMCKLLLYSVQPVVVSLWQSMYRPNYVHCKSILIPGFSCDLLGDDLLMPVSQSHSRQSSMDDSNGTSSQDSTAATEVKNTSVRKFTLGGDAWNKKNAKRRTVGSGQERESIAEKEEDDER